MEAEQEKLPQDRWYWGWYGIFITLMGISPFIPAWLGVPCFVIGIGGFFFQMRQGFVERLAFVRQIRVTWGQLLAFTRIAAVIMLAVLAIKTVSLVFENKNTLDVFVTPRTLPTEQAKGLRQYLAQHPSYAATVITSADNPEAIEYAAQLFNALHQTNWDVDLKFDTTRIATECLEGLCLRVEWPTKEGKVDPKHLPPHIILLNALHYSNIDCGDGQTENTGKYAVVILVGRRPRAIYKRSWMLHLYQEIEPHVERWFMPS